MRIHTVDSTYRQFYVADSGLEPDAPEDWNDGHIQQRFNAQENIVALCTEGQVTARVICVPPGERFHSEMRPDFKVCTRLNIESGRLGVYGWPWELLEEHDLSKGMYGVRFSGYNLIGVESEDDFYTVELEPAEAQQSPQ